MKCSSFPLLFAASVGLLLSIGRLEAQSVPAEKPGIALVKPQAWSKDDQASALEFLSAANHTGYYQFRTARNPAQQVPAAKVVAVIVYPDVPASITSAAERQALEKLIVEFANAQKRFPSAARQLEKAIAPVQADAATFDAGSIKENGAWVARSAYFQKKAAALADFIRPEIASAPRIKDLVLEEDQYYIGLKELAASEPSVQSVIKGVRALYDSRVRKDERDGLLVQLKAPGLSFDGAAELIAKLRTLQPAEEAAANLFLQSWDAAVGKAGDLTKKILGVQAEFEAAMQAAAESPEPPALPQTLVESVSAMTAATKQYRSGSPPAMIQVPLPLADSMTAFADNLPVLQKQVAARNLLDAKTILDSLVRQADMVGPNTAAALSGVQGRINAAVAKFLQLRDEAKMMAANDQVEAALKKYEEAYAIIPEKDIAAQMDALKKQ